MLAANGVETVIDAADGFTPTPVISHAILTHNRGRSERLADGIVITPSHNPPEDGGFKYNPPDGGPADTDITGAIEKDANALLAAGNREVRRVSLRQGLAAPTTHRRDYITPYVEDLRQVVDVEIIRSSGLRLGVDPMGGAAVAFWAPIAQRLGLAIEVVNDVVDPTFGFMTVDKDGRIRMDCSSPYAMASLIGLKDRFDLAFGNDTDCDRHGIVTRSGGLHEPESLPVRRDLVSVPESPRLARRRRRRQDAGVEQHDRPRRATAWAGGWSRCRSASSGSCPGCSTARSGSAARRARALRSCGATAACGPPTRTA